MNVTDCFINITSEDPDRLVAFYRDVVGLQLKPEMGDHSFHVGPGATQQLRQSARAFDFSSGDRRWAGVRAEFLLSHPYCDFCKPLTRAQSGNCRDASTRSTSTCRAACR